MSRTDLVDLVMDALADRAEDLADAELELFMNSLADLAEAELALVLDALAGRALDIGAADLGVVMNALERCGQLEAVGLAVLKAMGDRPRDHPRFDDLERAVLDAYGGSVPPWWAKAMAQRRLAGVVDPFTGAVTVATIPLAGHVTRLANFTYRPIEWLWEGRLPAGLLVDFVGPKGAGKSTLCIDLAARVSTGRPMPDGPAVGSAPADVVILPAEDSPSRIIRPRAEVAGGDLDRIHILENIVFPRQLDLFEKRLREVGARLVIIDVLMAFLAGVDSHKDQDIRTVMSPLTGIAERCNATIICLRHPHKGASAGSVANAGGGSVAIAAAARHLLLVAPDPRDPATRILAGDAPSNVAGPMTSLAYRISERTISYDDHGRPRTAPAIDWIGPSPLRATDLLGGDLDRDTEARLFLAEHQVDTITPDVVVAAEEHGISRATLFRAQAGNRALSGRKPQNHAQSQDPRGGGHETGTESCGFQPLSVADFIVTKVGVEPVSTDALVAAGTAAGHKAKTIRTTLPRLTRAGRIADLGPDPETPRGRIYGPPAGDR